MKRKVYHVEYTQPRVFVYTTCTTMCWTRLVRTYSGSSVATVACELQQLRLLWPHTHTPYARRPAHCNPLRHERHNIIASTHVAHWTNGHYGKSTQWRVKNVNCVYLQCQQLLGVRIVYIRGRARARGKNVFANDCVRLFGVAHCVTAALVLRSHWNLWREYALSCMGLVLCEVMY